jgi:eukaryotic-like serine/threonine-protein kinase
MASPRSANDILVGKVVAGRFRVVQLLGSGGTGHVYLAEIIGRAEAKPRRVALKVLRAEHRKDRALARFQREALAAARVRHPNLLEIIEVHVESAEVPCFAMELLVGLDLADTLGFHRVLASSRAARIAYELASGLAAAHEQGVIHRDVKPENIFLVHAADGRELVKLLDFGFAWLPGDRPRPSGGGPVSSPTIAVGTPEYMAPEQASGAPAEPSVDIYSLGIVLYEMLTGRVPFTGAYPGIAEKHRSAAPPTLRSLNPKLSASTEMEAVVMRAIAKEPGDRFASMTEFRDALLLTREASGVFPRSELDK